MHARVREPYWNADAAMGLVSSGSQPAARETSRGGARPRLPAQEPRAPFGCYQRAISLIVFRCMRGMCCAPWRAGRERATSGRPAIGGRGSAWPTHAARGEWAGRGAARGARRRAGWLLRRPQGRQAALHAWIGASVIRRCRRMLGALAALQLVTGVTTDDGVSEPYATVNASLSARSSFMRTGDRHCSTN